MWGGGGEKTKQNIETKLNETFKKMNNNNLPSYLEQETCLQESPDEGPGRRKGERMTEQSSSNDTLGPYLSLKDELFIDSGGW